MKNVMVLRKYEKCNGTSSNEKVMVLRQYEKCNGTSSHKNGNGILSV
jgi:hypothetical protein